MVHTKDIAVPYKILLAVSLTLLFLITTVPPVYSQKVRSEPPPFRERLFFGGSFGLQFGTLTDIDLSPVIGLWVLPRLAFAVGPKYEFYKYGNIRTSIYGAKAYTQFVVVQNFNNIIPLGINFGLFLHAEDELLSLESKYWKDPYATNRFYINTALIGGGISQPMGRRSSLNLIFLWALDDYYEIYGNPEIRVTFIF